MRSIYSVGPESDCGRCLLHVPKRLTTRAAIVQQSGPRVECRRGFCGMPRCGQTSHRRFGTLTCPQHPLMPVAACTASCCCNHRQVLGLHSVATTDVPHNKTYPSAAKRQHGPVIWARAYNALLPSAQLSLYAYSGSSRNLSLVTARL